MPPKFSAPEDQQERNLKTLVFIAIVLFSFTVLIGRLLQLQYIQYDDNLRRSEDNRIRKISVKAQRGLIMDRNQVVLVRNRPSYQVSLLSHQLKDRDSVFKRMLSITDTTGTRILDSAQLHFLFERGRWQRFRPQRIIEDASLAQVSIIEEHATELPGIETLIESRRDYPFGTLGAHVFGYTSEVSEEQLAKPEFSAYTFGDRIGKKGLEQQYEALFRGVNGVKYIEVNAYGKEIGLIDGMAHRAAIPGYHLVTTLDFNLQKVAEEAFPPDIKGGLVVLNPQNGEVYAMVSSPRLDPNIFSLEKRELAREWASVALDSMQPLNNRAIMGTYPPASVFKFMTAAAGLEYNFFTQDTRYKPCFGGFQFGRRYQRCWKPEGHGSMNVIDALRESCDTYFYQAALETDMAPINEVSRRFGLGDTLGIDLPGEKRGLLMDSITYVKRFKRLGWQWSRGQILNLAIGQGQLVTPLQQAVMFGAIASGKGVYKPHFMKEVRSHDGKVVQKYKPLKIKEGNLRGETRAILMQAMDEVVNSPRGTGKRAAVKDIRVGGKTGSAENPQGDVTHAWFAAVAPLENPTIALAIIMENAGGGGAMAGPIAGKILNAYFYEDSLRTKLRVRP
jgi:penicillin-binding protein 2